MKKTYPRLHIEKHEGMWEVHQLNSAGEEPSNETHLGSYMYWFDARRAAARLIGKPMRLTRTLGKRKTA